MKKLCIVGFIVLVCLIGFEQHFFTISLIHAQTIPTRTPVPPTQPPSGGGSGGGSNPNPAPTDTPVLPTATSTVTPIPPTLGPTPEGGYLPTAESCSNAPTIQTRNNTNVRRGPGTDYEVVGQLIYLEVRPIIGRAQNAEWWFITLADGTTGFVLDDVVTVSGYTDIVPVVPVPELDGSTPTPGPEWNPTPNPTCTVTPTPLPTNTPEPTATMTPEPTSTETAVAEAAPTDTAVLPTETPTLVAQPTRVTTPTPLPTAVPLGDQSQSSNINWLLYGVGGLLGIAMIMFLVRRR